MEARDLRIGNWVINFIGDYFQVNAYTLVNLGLYPVKQIELTEEILLQCGFEKISETELDLNGLIIETYNFYVEINKSNMLFRMPYLHQLQNLYLALTGEELEVCLT